MKIKPNLLQLCVILACAFIIGNGLVYSIPNINAFTIAGGLIGVDLGHCTIRYDCETKVCGDHLCQPGEASLRGQYWMPETPTQTLQNPVLNATVSTLQATPISPQDNAILTEFPFKFLVQVTRGGYPVEGASVQFWFDEHNVDLTTTDSSGFATLTILNQNTLNAGYYTWHATAIKAGFKGASTPSQSFNINSGNSVNFPTGGTVTTDSKEYSIRLANSTTVEISGNAHGYHIGDAIIIKIISPNGKSTQLVARGTYLGAFQTFYTLDNPKTGVYTVSAFYKYGVFSTSTFSIVK